MTEWKATAIKRARKSANLTQRQLAERVGVSASMIGQYEQETRDAKLPIMEKIADAMGLSIAELVGLPDNEDNNKCAREAILTDIPPDRLSAQKEKEKAELSDFLFADVSKTSTAVASAIIRMMHSKMSAREVEQTDVNTRLFSRIVNAVNALNADGKQVAAERLEELTMIPKYQKEAK